MNDNKRVVDAHQHYWELARFGYSWLTPKLSPIYRDFVPADLLPLMQSEGVDRSVLVQADSSFDEIEWMLSLAGTHSQVAGVVGWADLLDPDLENRLGRITQHASFKGVRPGIPLEAVGSKVLEKGFQTLAKYSLSCDLLVNMTILPVVEQLARQHPGVVFVLDHLAGVQVSPGGSPAWASDLKPLAYLPNVVMKLSGYLSAAEPKPLEIETLRAYIENALALFGADRLMFGSDWPVCTLGGPYERAVGLLRAATEKLSEVEKDAVWGGTAVKVYRLLA